ncbi:MAG: hypothetical protein JWN23_894 [Rhodocyclales bacterium]|nr:hypothetical protein [Rhodocyclales bacterium]
MSILTTDADPIYAQPLAERPAYATGMLLDAQDFSDEQTYHRGRLARAMAFLAGGGTLAGLQAGYVAATATQPEEISVQPGLAVDRLGRLVEIPRPACLRLANWYALINAQDSGATLTESAYGNLGRFASQRATDAALALPARAVVADVFIRFAECPVGLTPSFAAGPFDALNAVTTSRIRDAYELQLMPRTTLSDTYNGLPLPLVNPTLVGSADAKVRRNAAQDSVLNGYAGSGHAGGSGGLAPLPEQPDGLDPSAVFLARIFVPIGAGNPPTRTADAVVIDNFARRFLPSAALLSQWAGF